MTYRHLRKMPHAYELEYRDDGFVNVWLCRQVDTYVCDDGIREYDIDVRVACGIENTPELETDIRLRYEAWWNMAAKEG